jgi:hypothetical protein
MEALKNLKLIQAAREEAQRLVAHEPSLASHRALAARVAAIQHELHQE